MTTLRNRLPVTCEDTIGPYYPLSFTDDDPMDLSRVHPGLVLRPRGRPIEIEGRLLDIDGRLAHGAVIEFWQPDADGRLRGPDVLADPALDPHFQGYARVRTDDGAFRLRTVMPGPSRVDGGAARAPFVTVTIFSDGFTRLVTQIFFDGEAENAADPVLLTVAPERRPSLVARPNGLVRDGAAVYGVDIVLAGERETPFFDDLAEVESPMTRGRILAIGPTDRTSAERTPRQPLLTIPASSRQSFVPWLARVPGLRLGENDLTRLAPGRPRAQGEHIEVGGRLSDAYGRPLRGVLLEIWNANTHGRYAHRDDMHDYPLDPHFIGVGRTLTDDDGRYRFWTVKPGSYLARADIGRWRPSHIHVSVRGGAARLITQMYFAGDPYNAADPMRILMGDDFDRQIGRDYVPETAGVARGFQFDIVVGGPNVTFFEPPPASSAP